MNELREQVQGLIDKHDVDSYRASVGAEHSSYPSATVTTDRILALIADAMLSEKAVRSIVAAHKGFIWSWKEYDGDPDSLGWNDDGWAKEYIRDLCTAAGITPGDAQEGGEGE